MTIYFSTSWAFLYQEFHVLRDDLGTCFSSFKSKQMFMAATQPLESRRSTPASWRTSLRSGHFKLRCQGHFSVKKSQDFFCMVWNRKMMSFKIPFVNCNVKKVGYYDTSMNTGTMESDDWWSQLSWTDSASYIQHRYIDNLIPMYSSACPNVITYFLIPKGLGDV